MSSCVIVVRSQVTKKAWSSSRLEMLPLAIAAQQLPDRVLHPVQNASSLGSNPTHCVSSRIFRSRSASSCFMALRSTANRSMDTGRRTRTPRLSPSSAGADRHRGDDDQACCQVLEERIGVQMLKPLFTSASMITPAIERQIAPWPP